MKKSDYQLDEVKKIELDILKEFIRICELLHLRYFAIDGTALGAVRHGGFIPWDDDIDVALPRADYEIFLKHAQELLPKHYFLQTLDTDPDYLRGFSKIRNSNTTFIETAAMKLHMNHGIYIDVFPLDGYNYSKFDEILFKFKKIMFEDRIDEGFYHRTAPEKRPLKTELVGKIMKLFSRTMTPKKAAYRLEAMIQKYGYDACAAVGSLYDSIYKREVVPKEYYGNGREINFESIPIRVPEKVELLLEHIYGDYMQYPPKSKRIPQHSCEIIDCTTPYTAYIK